MRGFWGRWAEEGERTGRAGRGTAGDRSMAHDEDRSAQGNGRAAEGGEYGKGDSGAGREREVAWLGSLPGDEGGCGTSGLL